MGNACICHANSVDDLSQSVQRAMSRICEKRGVMNVVGRYHRLPVRIHDDYSVTTEVLGEGLNGAVFAANSKLNGCRFAVKRLNMRNISVQSRRELVNELELLLSVDHPNIATLIDAYESEQHIDLVLECMDGGTLCEFVRAEKRISEERACKLVKEMLMAVNYLHTRNYVHRDLKLDNFLLVKPGVGPLKLIDFGTSRYLDPKKTLSTLNATGTLAYSAPEVLDGSYNNKCDVWSIGVIAFILLVGYMPFYGNKEAMRNMVRHSDPMGNGPKQRWNDISPQAKDLVRNLLSKDPVQRISVAAALEHEWITAAGQQTYLNAQALDYTSAALQFFTQTSRFWRACMVMMAWSVPCVEQDDICKAFLDLDTERKGAIKIQNLIDQLSLTNEQKQQISQVLDESFGKELCYTDFLAAAFCTRIVQNKDLCQKAFRRFDVSNSGLVKEEDLQNVLGKDFDCAGVVSQFPGSQISAVTFLEYLDSEAGQSVALESVGCTNSLDPVSLGTASELAALQQSLI